MLVARFFIALMILSAAAEAALGCACCAEIGSYSLITARPSSYQLTILDEMKFSKTADLFTTEAGFDGIKGLKPIQAEYESDSWTADSNFSVVDAFLKRTWQLTFRTPKGKSGVLTLPMPVRMTSFSADIHDGSDHGLGPLLYKELRFEGAVSNGSGIFRGGMLKPVKYLLVFQGRGNYCDNSSDYTHWHLAITGPGADYEFFGEMDRSAIDTDGN